MVGRAIGRIVCVCLAGLLLSAPSAFAQANPCEACGPGPHWIDDCVQGDDYIAVHEARVGVDIDLDCDADFTVTLRYSCGELIVRRSMPRDDSSFFPGFRPVDGHLDVIDTEIISMCLESGGPPGDNVTLWAGLGLAGIAQRSRGAIGELPGNPLLGESFFDVYFAVDLGGGQMVYNHAPMRLVETIDCVPPGGTYVWAGGCLGLYNDPVAGVRVANLVTATHSVNTKAIGRVYPTLTQWGVILLVASLIAIGVVVLLRRRRLQAA